MFLILAPNGVFGGGELNGAIYTYPEPTLVAMVTKI